MRTTTLSFPVRESGMNGLQLVLARRRGSIEVRATRPEVVQAELKSRTLRLLWPAALDLGEPVSVTLGLTGEDVLVASSEFKHVPEAELLEVGGDLEGLAFSTGETPVGDVFAWRKARATGLFAAEKAFFNALDEATWVVDPEQQEVLDLLDLILKKRQDGDAAGLAALQATARAPLIQKFSSAVIDSATNTLGDPRTHLPQLEDAFDRFARGELSLLDATDSPTDPTFAEYKSMACQPDSIYYFHFAEFASLCIDGGVDPAFWTALLPTLVQSQAGFFEAYKGPGGNPIPYGHLLGGKWPPAVALAVDPLHAQRQSFKASYLALLEDVRQNYLKQYVDL